jgi:hypothetical protein
MIDHSTKPKPKYQQHADSYHLRQRDAPEQAGVMTQREFGLLTDQNLGESAGALPGRHPLLRVAHDPNVQAVVGGL